MKTAQVLINGSWCNATSSSTFQAVNPLTKESLNEEYPVSQWDDCEAALEAAKQAYDSSRSLPGERMAAFLERYAELIEQAADRLVDMAHAETGLPKSPRLADGELVRTTSQLRQAATCARSENWRQPVIDAAANIRSCYNAIGPVAVFGPNNFPFAFGSISGGDFAAAIAAGNPVIAKANSSHPGTTRIFAELAQQAAEDCELPPGTVQLIYRLSHSDGERLVSDSRLAATGYTGSRSAGLKLKSAADAAGNPIYLELSSINPVVILPGALAERAESIAEEFTSSCLMGTGQFCTNPGLVILLNDDESDKFVSQLVHRFQAAPVGTLLSGGVATSLESSIKELISAGAAVLAGNLPAESDRFCFSNTLLQITGKQFLSNPTLLQTEAFGNASTILVAESIEEIVSVICALEGNLTGCIYSHTAGTDDKAYNLIAPHLRQRVGRLLNDQMPTGVAVSPAMNHGGPYPATGHAGFTAVGLPAAILRFSMLQCYDNVREHRLPEILKNE